MASGRILRSVLMKPETEVHVPALHQQVLGLLAGSCTARLELVPVDLLRDDRRAVPDQVGICSMVTPCAFPKERLSYAVPGGGRSVR
jgi:hypothetical protein